MSKSFADWYVMNGLALDAEEDEQWITTKNGHHVLIDGEGEIQAGMGGKFDGQKIDKIPVKHSPKLGTSAETKKKLNEIKQSEINRATTHIRMYGGDMESPEVKEALERAEKRVQGAIDKLDTREDLSDSDKEAMIAKYSEYCRDEAKYESGVWGRPQAEEYRIKQSQMKILENAINGTLKENMLPAKLGDTQRGNPMTPEEADELNANPDYYTNYDCMMNCQTCVVAYEARLRGYDVEAAPNSNNFTTGWAVSQNVTSPFYDAKTGLSPKETEIRLDSPTPQKVREFLEKNLNDGERYCLSVEWQSGGGHIMNMEKRDGKLCLIDAQSGDITTDPRGVDYIFERAYLDQRPPQYFRVDNMSFNPDVCTSELLMPKRKKAS